VAPLVTSFIQSLKIPASSPIWTPQDFALLGRLLPTFRPDPLAHRRWCKATHTPLRPHYTFHSFKRGAAALLWVKVAEGQITETDLLRMLKHKSLESALAYCPLPAVAAKAVGSKAAVFTMIWTWLTESLKFLHPRTKPPMSLLTRPLTSTAVIDGPP
jgi:hypothetical protein